MRHPGPTPCSSKDLRRYATTWLTGLALLILPQAALGWPTAADRDAGDPIWWTLSDRITPQELRDFTLDSASHAEAYTAQESRGSCRFGGTLRCLGDGSFQVTFFVNGAESPEKIPMWKAFERFAHDLAGDPGRTFDDLMAGDDFTAAGALEIIDEGIFNGTREELIQQQIDGEAARLEAERQRLTQRQPDAAATRQATSDLDAAVRVLEERQAEIEAARESLQALRTALQGQDWQYLRKHLLEEIAPKIVVAAFNRGETVDWVEIYDFGFTINAPAAPDLWTAQAEGAVSYSCTGGVSCPLDGGSLSAGCYLADEWHGPINHVTTYEETHHFPPSTPGIGISGKTDIECDPVFFARPGPLGNVSHKACGPRPTGGFGMRALMNTVATDTEGVIQCTLCKEAQSTCTEAHSIRGSISGLTGDETTTVHLTAADENGVVQANELRTRATAYDFGPLFYPYWSYALTILSEPGGKRCYIESSSGVMGNEDAVANVHCGEKVDVLVETSGLPAGETAKVRGILRFNGQVASDEELLITENGLHAFGGPTIPGMSIALSVVQGNCELSPSSGTLTANSNFVTHMDCDTPGTEHVVRVLVEDGDTGDGSPQTVTVQMTVDGVTETQPFSVGPAAAFDMRVSQGQQMQFFAVRDFGNPGWTCFAQPGFAVMGSEDFLVTVECLDLMLPGPGFDPCDLNVEFCITPPSPLSCNLFDHVTTTTTWTFTVSDTNNDNIIDEHDEGVYDEDVTYTHRFTYQCSSTFAAPSVARGGPAPGEATGETPGETPGSGDVYDGPGLALIFPDPGSIHRGEFQLVGFAIDVEDGVTDLRFFIDEQEVTPRSLIVGETNESYCDDWPASDGPCDPDSLFRAILDAGPLSPGNHQVQVVAQNGHPTMPLATLQRLDFVADPPSGDPCATDTTPPSAWLTAPADGLVLPTNTSATFTAGASDANGIDFVDVWVNGGAVVDLRRFGEGPYSWSLSAPTAGEYTWRIVAHDTCGLSRTSTTRHVTVVAEPPEPPTNVFASINLEERISVSWSGSAGAASYQVWRNPNSNNPSGATLRATVSGTSYNDTAIQNERWYYYFIKAKNADGTSGFSAVSPGNGNAGYALAPPQVDPPQPPTNVFASIDGSDSILVRWTAPAGATAYEIWRNPSSNHSSGAVLINGHFTGTLYEDFSAAVGQWYYYFIKAKNAGGASGFSAVTVANGNGGVRVP